MVRLQRAVGGYGEDPFLLMDRHYGAAEMGRCLVCLPASLECEASAACPFDGLRATGGC